MGTVAAERLRSPNVRHCTRDMKRFPYQSQYKDALATLVAEGEATLRSVGGKPQHAIVDIADRSNRPRHVEAPVKSGRAVTPPRRGIVGNVRNCV